MSGSYVPVLWLYGGAFLLGAVSFLMLTRLAAGKERGAMAEAAPAMVTDAAA